MSLTNTFVSLVQTACRAKPRKYLTDKILISVLQEESECEPLFLKTDAQYRQNMRSAMETTGLTEEVILSWLPLGGRGQIPKFRLEPGTWNSHANIPNPDRFYYSSSWGLGQCMGFNFLKYEATSTWQEQTTNFAWNLSAQMLTCANEMERLLTITKGNVFHAYCGYNSGNVNSKNPDVIKRAHDVEDRVING